MEFILIIPHIKWSSLHVHTSVELTLRLREDDKKGHSSLIWALLALLVWKLEQLLTIVNNFDCGLWLEPWRSSKSTTKAAKMVGEGRERLNFFRKTIFRMARSWAKIPALSWSHVESTLFKQCPKFDNHEDEVWQLGEDGQHAILALGIYFLESGCQHADKIVPYLLKVESGFLRIKILDKKSMTHRKLIIFSILRMFNYEKCILTLIMTKTVLPFS